MDRKSVSLSLTVSLSFLFLFCFLYLLVVKVAQLFEEKVSFKYGINEVRI